MAQVINTNIASLTAQRNLAANQNEAATAMQRLSSGLRINSAKDDAAGLAIANRLTSQINGVNQAIRNASDGASVVQVAEGALQESSNILQRMRELAVQSANASNSASDRTMLQSEVTELAAEMTRIANTTAFGNTKLLNGGFASQTFQVGAQVGETISLSISAARASDLGTTYTATGFLDELGRAEGSGATTNGVTAQTLTFNVEGQTTNVSIAVDSTAKDVAAAVSTVGGLTASASTTATFQFTAGTTGEASATVTINGVQLTGVDLSGNATAKATALEAAINADSTLSANLTVSRSTDTITLTDADGDNISIATGDLDASAAASTDIAVVTNSLSAVTLDGGTSDSLVVTGTVTVTADKEYAAGDLTVYSSDTSGQIISETVAAPRQPTSVDAGSTRIDSMSIATVTGANLAIATIDAALTTIDSQRATLGAVSSRFDSVIAGLSAQSENATAGRSRIMDADFAAETAQLAKSQILQQAGISVLAQANAQPQNVLALLQ
jgi:flagellin